MRKIILSFLIFAGSLAFGFAQENHSESEQNEASQEQHANPEHHDEGHGCACHEHHEEKFDPAATAFHHTGDANVFQIFGTLFMPLPCILYAPDQGLSFFMSSKFGKLDAHGTGMKAIGRYVLVDGSVMRVPEAKFPAEEVEIECVNHNKALVGTDSVDVYEVVYNGECYDLEKKSTLDGGILGGGLTSFYDFSLTKNVLTMILTFIVLFWLFRQAVKGYAARKGQAPKGVQSVLEPIFTFIRDEVAIPFLGNKYEKYLPFLMSIFFFILGLNLIGQIPVIGGNVTGNLAVTMVLALITFFITNFSGNKHYWEHTLWMPGVPALLKVLILTPVEIMGLFIKPLTLMLRLFANITGGHIVMVIFVGLIFIFGESGKNLGGGVVGTLMAVPLTMFMMALELLVALVQAFVFCILSASYISAAIEEPHHH
ncbi:MAG: F0F1 ATP synthase subunit A [Saprospiraceae bacterium]|nr:F0F1 ATP synthase subunit A [Saprospiraceae bacterium]